MTLQDKQVVVTGGTGSLGRALVYRLLGGRHGLPAKVIVFSRDEAKQHEMRLDSMGLARATDEVIYENFRRRLDFRIGDVRDPASLRSGLRGAQLVFHAAALKQVPTCEYFPYEAVRTNIEGSQNLVQAAGELGLEAAVGISTDKACKPVNVMGMTKALQERIFSTANLHFPHTRFVSVRYGNVLASRGSVIPLFREQIARGGPVTLTSPAMTRFLLPLDQAVDTVLAAVQEGRPGEVWVPRIRAARLQDVAEVMIGERPIAIEVSGIRPGEKLHEVLISEEEAPRTRQHHDCYVIGPLLPELVSTGAEGALQGDYSSADHLLDRAGVRSLLEGYR